MKNSLIEKLEKEDRDQMIMMAKTRIMAGRKNDDPKLAGELVEDFFQANPWKYPKLSFDEKIEWAEISISIADEEYHGF